MSLQFTWDPQKAARNLRKHKVGLPEAATAFADLCRWPSLTPITRLGRHASSWLVNPSAADWWSWRMSNAGTWSESSVPALLPAVSGRPMKKKP